ncbi:MAG: PQQ-binding-like beta-propeller repeat protein [Bacteroidetes bacterium]|nr:PQQ-binding-like beta-propeller repeat protein [Bacteroidota bacterium]
MPPGHSSPVVSGGRVYLTAVRGRKLLTICQDRSSGKMLWEAEAPYEKLERAHRIGSQATPSVATDGRHVFSFFGSSGLFCYTTGGREVWRRKMGPFDNQFGATSSPILADGRIIMIQDQFNQAAITFTRLFFNNTFQ